MRMPQNMFQHYGGAEKVSDLIFAFYDRVLSSERLAPFFATCDMRRLMEHQTRYISAVMGGPPSYSEAHLREVHATLGITNADFDEMLSLLRVAMTDSGYDAADTDQIIRRLSALRRVIVAK